MLHHLAPQGSMALLLANGSMSSGSGGEGEIRRALIEADLVECMVALPGQLFTNTQIPACIWFLTKSKAARPLNSQPQTSTRSATAPARPCSFTEELKVDRSPLPLVKPPDPWRSKVNNHSSAFCRAYAAEVCLKKLRPRKLHSR
jgi:type I restriction-modification system DNA methylase subunit